MSFSNIKHVFFDLDHTLWNFDKNSAFAFEAIFKIYNFDISLSEFLEIYIPRNQHYWKLYQLNQVSHQDLRYFRFKDVFDALNFSISDEQIHQLSEAYIEHLPNHNHLFDGTFEILDYLKPKYQLHIITNGFSQVQGKKMVNSKIDHYFETITNSEMAGQKKPHPQIFAHALKTAKASKDESIMIGDSLEADIHGAINFGIKVVYFNEQNLNHNLEVPQIHHLLELKRIL